MLTLCVGGDGAASGISDLFTIGGELGFERMIGIAVDDGSYSLNCCPKRERSLQVTTLMRHPFYSQYSNPPERWPLNKRPLAVQFNDDAFLRCKNL